MPEKVVKPKDDEVWEWQYTLKDEQGEVTFQIDKRGMVAFFFQHFEGSLSSGHSNLSRLVTDLTNQDKITQEEAEERARQMHKAAATVHAQFAFRQFSQTFGEVLNTFFKMAQANAIQHARAELSKRPIRIRGKTWEESWELIFRHPERKVLQAEALNFFIELIKKIQRTQEAGRPQKVTPQILDEGPKLFCEILKRCEEIKIYHDLNKAVFDHKHKRNGYHNDDWVVVWLSIAEQHYGEPPTFMPKGFFERFASLDRQARKPKQIALEAAANVCDMAPSTFDKYILRPSRLDKQGRTVKNRIKNKSNSIQKKASGIGRK